MGFLCCDTQITNERLWRVHMKIHFIHGSEKNDEFKCPICSISVNRKANFKQHLINFHPRHVIDVFTSQNQQLDQSENQQNTPNPFMFNVPGANRIELNSDTETNIQFDDDVEMDSTEVQLDYEQDDVPYLNNDNIQFDLIRDYDTMFAKLLTGLKSKLNCAQKHLNLIATTILTFVLGLLLNNLLNQGIINELIKISKSTYLQHRSVDRLQLVKRPAHNFYYTNLREVIGKSLEKPEVCEQLFYEKKRKLFIFFN